MATFKCAAPTTEFLSAEQVAVIFADRRSVDILSEGSSCESADESFWESSAVDTASENEENEDVSGSARAELHSSSDYNGSNCDDSDCDRMPPTKKL